MDWTKVFKEVVSKHKSEELQELKKIFLDFSERVYTDIELIDESLNKIRQTIDEKIGFLTSKDKHLLDRLRFIESRIEELNHSLTGVYNLDEDENLMSKYFEEIATKLAEKVQNRNRFIASILAFSVLNTLLLCGVIFVLLKG